MRRQARDEILDAAERTFDTFGYAKATMEDVAREAGVGRTTIYLHFKTKEELALASLDRIHDRAVENLTRIASQSDLAPAERVRQMLLGRIRFGFDHGRGRRDDPDRSQAILPLYIHRRQQYLEVDAGVFEAVLREGVASGDLAVENCPRAAFALILATNALLPFSLTPRMRDDWPAIESAAETLTGLLLNGLKSR